MPDVHALVSRLVADRAGWDLVATRGEEARLVFECRAGDGGAFSVWVMPDDGREPCLAATGTFRLGYRGDRFAAAENELLKAVYRGLVHAERSEGPLDFRPPAAEDAGPAPALIYGGDTFEIRLTLACNERCVFCNSPDIAQNLAVEKEAALRLVERAGQAGPRKLVVTGGEPLLVPWVDEVVAAARRHGFDYVVVQSNGVELSQRRGLERLQRVAPDEVLVSIHGSNAETVGAITGRGHLFARKLAGYRASLENPWKTSVSFVLCRQNITDMPATMDLLSAQPRRPFLVSASCVAPSGLARERGEGVMPRLSEAAPHMLAGLRRARELGLRIELAEYCGIPTCIDPALREFAEPHVEGRVLEVPADKTLVPRCGACAWRSRCTGVFRHYLALFGDEEFRAQ